MIALYATAEKQLLNWSHQKKVHPVVVYIYILEWLIRRAQCSTFLKMKGSS